MFDFDISRLKKWGCQVWVRFPRYGKWYKGEVEHWTCGLNISIRFLENVGPMQAGALTTRTAFELKLRADDTRPKGE